MEYSLEDFETVRLLRAFSKVQDPEKRREIIELVKNIAAAAANGDPDNEQSKPSR